MASTGPNSMQTARLGAALLAAERGWHVFPLLPDSKHPAIKRWEQRATTDQNVIRAHWIAHPDRNVGIATGPSGLVVVDLDLARPGQPAPEGLSIGGITSGAQVLTLLAHQASSTVPDTYTVATPSGGQHLYFRAPAGPPTRSTAGTLGWLIDTRAHGGYVVAPGSTLPGGAYELIDDHDPAILPAWLSRALAPKPPPGHSAPAEVPSQRLDSYVATVVRDQVQRVRSAPSGQHNKTVFVAACRLGELVGARALDEGTALHMLKQSAAPLVGSTCQCTERGIENTIRSGLRTGALRPRTNLPAVDRKARA